MAGFELPARLDTRRLSVLARAAGLQVVGEGIEEIEAVYFDTQDGRLHRAGLRLRRRAGSGWEMTEGGVVRLVAAGRERPRSRSRLARVAAELCGARPLVPLLTVEGVERALLVEGAAGLRAALVRLAVRARDPFDESRSGRAGVISVVGTKGTGPAATLAAALARAGFRPRDDDVVTAGLRAAGRPLPGAPLPEGLRLAAGDTLGDAARKVFTRQAYKIDANLAGAARDLDPEYVHDMRVATRRARAALRVFCAVVPDARRARLRGELAWIGGLLGKVRDLDVLSARTAEHCVRVAAPEDARHTLLATIESWRRAARLELEPALAGPRFRRLLGVLSAGRFVAVRSAGGQPAHAESGRRIRKAIRAVRNADQEAGAVPTDEAIHRLRIEFKRMRYACEFFADLYGEGIRDVITGLVRFQDCLGRHQDAVVALARLTEAFRLHEGSPAVARVLGALEQVQREEIAAERERFAQLRPELPKLLRRLRRALARPQLPT